MQKAAGSPDGRKEVFASRKMGIKFSPLYPLLPAILSLNRIRRKIISVDFEKEFFIIISRGDVMKAIIFFVVFVVFLIVVGLIEGARTKPEDDDSGSAPDIIIGEKVHGPFDAFKKKKDK